MPTTAPSVGGDHAPTSLLNMGPQELQDKVHAFLCTADLLRLSCVNRSTFRGGCISSNTWRKAAQHEAQRVKGAGERVEVWRKIADELAEFADDVADDFDRERNLLAAWRGMWLLRGAAGEVRACTSRGAGEEAVR